MYNSVGKWLRLVIPSARTAVRRSSFNRCNESRQRFDRLLVLDFEATCDSKRGTIRPQVKQQCCCCFAFTTMMIKSSDM